MLWRQQAERTAEPDRPQLRDHGRAHGGREGASVTSAQMHRDARKHAEWLPTGQPRQGPAPSRLGSVSLNPKIPSFEEGLEELQPALPRSGAWTRVSPEQNDSHGALPPRTPLAQGPGLRCAPAEAACGGCRAHNVVSVPAHRGSRSSGWYLHSVTIPSFVVLRDASSSCGPRPTAGVGGRGWLPPKRTATYGVGGMVGALPAST